MTSETTTKNDELSVDRAIAAIVTTAAPASTQTSFDQGLVKSSPLEYFIQIPVIVIAT
jgi:hypothetical protein